MTTDAKPQTLAAIWPAHEKILAAAMPDGKAPAGARLMFYAGAAAALGLIQDATEETVEAVVAGVLAEVTEATGARPD